MTHESTYELRYHWNGKNYFFYYFKIFFDFRIFEWKKKSISNDRIWNCRLANIISDTKDWSEEKIEDKRNTRTHAM